MSLVVRLAARLGGFALDLDFEAPARGMTVVFGPSGAGKSTLLRAVAGLDRHGGARVVLGGETWQDGRAFVPAWRRGLGMVFQEAGLFDHLTVRRNLEYGAKRAGARSGAGAVVRAAELAGVTALLDRRPATLSGGQRQRAAIARALAAGPRLLLLDEPLASLDGAARRDLMGCLERLHAELAIPVLYVTHARDEMARLADHLVLLDEGRVQAAGSAADLLVRLDLPLAHDPEAEAIVPAVIAGYDEVHHLALLDSPAGRLCIVGDGTPAGTAVRLRVAARDVSLALETPGATSILNILPAVVREIAPTGDAQATVRLDAGGAALLARVTRKSAATLGLRPGLPVLAQVKSVAVAR